LHCGSLASDQSPVHSFFLGIAILQFFSEFSTVSPGVVILPLIIVIAVTALKDGYEDVKRHQSDKRVNQSQIRVLSGGGWVNPNGAGAKSKTFVRGLLPKGKGGRQGSKDIEMQVRGAPPEAIAATRDQSEPGHDHGESIYDEDEAATEEHRGPLHAHGKHAADDRAHWLKTSWEDVRVGDFVKLVADEALPADVLICATSEEENVAFVETKNLDGETNLKSRHAVPALTRFRTAAACADPANAFHIECDRPDANMYKLNAAVVTSDGERAPVELPMTLLRGTVLRNTAWVIGIVLFTGEDTKIVLNSGGTPSKRSKVERQMNPQVFINLAILALMSTVCAIADSSLEKFYYPKGAPWLYADDKPDNNPSINGLITWAFALITFQNIIPISLYISIEAVRTIQAAFIYFDSEIYYEKLDQPTLARSWNLSDDLGQIEYIFSDKTGTLTQVGLMLWPLLHMLTHIPELHGVPGMLSRWPRVPRRPGDEAGRLPGCDKAGAYQCAALHHERLRHIWRCPNRRHTCSRPDGSGGSCTFVGRASALQGLQALRRDRRGRPGLGGSDMVTHDERLLHCSCTLPLGAHRR
jgi:phospholipid-translocating ATPase